MSLKEQFEKLKENWLMILLIVVVLGAMMYLPSTGISNGYNYKSVSDSAYGGGYYPGAAADSYLNYSQNQSIAPTVQNRKIVKTYNLGIETKIGRFYSLDSQVRDIVKSSNSFILTENIYSNKTNSRDVFTGSYTIKVENTKLEATTNQLKALGKVTSYNQGAEDVTGSYTNVTIELKVEKDRLERYKEMYADANTMADKIDLNDRIFNQERTIKYLEDSVKNIDERVDYSTIYLTVNENSNYLGIVLVKFSDLATSFVNSLNSLLRLIFVILPWAVIAGIIYVIARVTRKPETKAIKRR